MQATTINEEMKVAAAQAIAELARQQVPEEVASAYGKNHKFGTDYIIPAPFDPRLIEVVSSAVAKAAMDSGVAKARIEDFDAYRMQLRSRLNPTTSVLSGVYEIAKSNPKRMVFAEAEEEVVLRAAIQYRDFGYGTPILVGRTKAVLDKLHQLSVADPGSFEIQNSADSEFVPAMVDLLYKRLQRRGFTERDVRRMVNQERNVFAALLVALGHGDGIITGMTRTYCADRAQRCNLVLDHKQGRTAVVGIHMMIGKKPPLTFRAGTTINRAAGRAGTCPLSPRRPAAVARGARWGHEPRVALPELFRPSATLPASGLNTFIPRAGGDPPTARIRGFRI